MASRDDIVIEITPQVLLKAYACGIFPMAESADDPGLYWIEPQQRGILPLDQRACAARGSPGPSATAVFEIRIDTRLRGRDRRLRRVAARPAHDLDQPPDPQRSIATCSTPATATRSRPGQTGRLVGGLYGVALGGAFFGESMFSSERDASKVALVHLCARLNRGGFRCSTPSSSPST